MAAISDLGTKINGEKLREWADKLPGCRIFLENFFGTCQPYPVEVNYLNYLQDLVLYGLTKKYIRENFNPLLKAFSEITGAEQGQLEKKLEVMLKDMYRPRE